MTRSLLLALALALLVSLLLVAAQHSEDAAADRELEDALEDLHERGLEDDSDEPRHLEDGDNDWGRSLEDDSDEPRHLEDDDNDWGRSLRDDSDEPRELEEEEDGDNTRHIPATKFIVDLGDTPLGVGAPLPASIIQFTDLLADKSGAASDRINWDGPGVVSFLGNLRSKVLPRDFFLKGQGNNSTAKFILTNGGHEKAVVSFSDDAFSPRVVFGPLRTKKKITMTFPLNVRGRSLGLVYGFGAVFLGVRRRHVQGIQFYDHRGHLLLTLVAKPNKFQFLGAVFESAVIAKVVLFFDPHVEPDLDDIFFDLRPVRRT